MYAVDALAAAAPATEPPAPAPQRMRTPPCPGVGGWMTDLLLPAMRDTVVAPKKKAWEEALGGEEAARPLIRSRLAGWPSRILIDAATLPDGHLEFAQRLARDTWSGLAALADRENGLPIDHVHFAAESVDPAQSRIGDYSSGTNIGLHLIATVAAAELGLIPAAEALERARRILATIERLETYQGFLFNFYDTTSLERTSNFISFVDASWLTAGLMVVRATFPELYEQCSRLIRQTDYGFFYDPDSGQLSHGYYVNVRMRSPYHYGVLYSEARIGSLIAIGKGDVPERHWFEMVRTFPASCTAQRLRPRGVTLKTIRGYAFDAGYYEWNGLRYVPSWGGSMFEALMPSIVLNERQYAPHSLGRNDEVHAAIQRRYALENLGYGSWGMSPSATPTGNGYGEYGVTVLGTRGYAAGAVTPHASALAVVVEPDAALTNLQALARRYPMYGEYGFYDALDPRSGAIANTYLALNQSLIFIALANHLKEGVIQKRFAADPIIQAVLPMIAAEHFFE